jgi:hypothetical protein
MKYIMTIMSTIKTTGLPNRTCRRFGGAPGVPAGAPDPAAGVVAVACARITFNTFKCII